MSRRWLWLTLLVGAALLIAVPADAKRVALVVGINAYDNFKPEQQLRKAVNDARAIAATLKGVGFEVITAEDTDRVSFLRTWQRFLNTVKPGDTTAIFFAGHGIEMDGMNYVLPRDVPVPEDGQEVLRGSAIRVYWLMERLREQNPQVTIWIIDACRDSPYAGRATRSLGTARGLKREDPPKGSLIMMSAGAGQSALDALSAADANPNSVYTRTLLPLLREPGLEITDLARRVRGNVEALAASVQHEQRPAFYHELSGNFYLVEPDPARVAAATSSAAGLSEAAQAWATAKDTNDLALLEAYVRQFNGTFYAGLAQARLTELRKSGVPSIVSAAPAVSAPGRPAQIPPTVPQESKPPTAMESAQAWLAVKDTGDVASLERFLSRHGASIYADMAKELAKQKRPSALAALGSNTPGVSPTVRGEQLAVTVAPSRPVVPNTATPAVGAYPAARMEPLSASQERALVPSDTFQECAKCPVMIVIPPGRFTMGSPDNETGRAANEGPQRTVSINKAFAAAKFAVTFDEWDACVAGGGCNAYSPADIGGRRGRHPVVNVSWDDTQAYVAWLTKATGKPYRLLSEAEREYVTRAGTTAPFWFGTTITARQANYDSTASYANGPKGEARQRTLPVDFFGPNAFGLYQVHGNIQEWTEDCWRPSYAGAPNDGSPRMQEGCGGRVLRGGAFADGPSALRSAARVGFAPGNRTPAVGFRVARGL
jgi:formylglycine-generating enzyme required for sulfatase activity/uncharacterized caspase-like protein